MTEPNYIRVDPITGRRFAIFRAGCGGTVQIVERTDGACTVGFLARGSLWYVDWGYGDGGFLATCERFDYSGNPPEKQTFVPLR